MKILFDGHWWVDGPPSGRNVLRALVVAWTQAFPDDAITLRVPKAHVTVVRDELRSAQLAVVVEDYPTWTRYQAAAVASIAARRNCYDAVVTQNFCPPLSTCARVALLHDVLFVTNPEWFTRAELLYLSAIRPSLRRATAVLTTSSSETDRVRSVWPELRARLVQVGLSVPDGLIAAKPVRPSGLPASDPFILTVGRLNVRKNLARLIEAFIRLADDDLDHHLIIVGGQDGAYKPTSIPDHLAARIHFLGHVTDDGLRWLYENCDLFICPSLGEGYGLPLIEANVLGARVIASDIPVFRELAIAAAYFDPASADDIAAAIRRGLGSAHVPVAGLPTWQEVAHNVRQAIEKGPAGLNGLLLAGLRRRINTRYAHSRRVNAGIDDRISDVAVIRFATRKLAARIRGVARGLPHIFLDRNVVILNRSGLRLGRGVSIGRGVLIDALAENGVVLDDGATVDVNAVIRGTGTIRRLGVGVSVGARAAIGADNFIHGGGGVEIGADVLLGPSVRIFSENHNFGLIDVPIIEQGETPDRVRVGNGAWIGAGSTILPGVQIGEGAIVAAGSVVTRSVEAFTIVAGCPAQWIKDRPR
ncbi:glycosyltransferase [Mycobacterium sp. SM3041]|uniref:glycosyltransferase n=1 Tax=Mycobacterium sp. SM3041 TaxID=3114291 RepID=UPI00320462E5